MKTVWTIGVYGLAMIGGVSICYALLWAIDLRVENALHRVARRELRQMVDEAVAARQVHVYPVQLAEKVEE